MCVSEAGLVVSVEADETALCSVNGARRRVPLIILTAAGETVAPGDWLLIHTGLAVARLTADEAAAHYSYLPQSSVRQGGNHG
jgi:hydrogenase expression/formation protein HypC